MMKARMLWLLLAAWLVLVLATMAYGGLEAQGSLPTATPMVEYQNYLPMVLKEWPPTPTPVLPTVTPLPPTATPTVAPDLWLKFLTGVYDVEMKGLMTGGTRRTSLTNYWGDVIYPQGIFIVLFMDVQNCSMGSAYVTGINTFWMRSGDGPFFDMAPLGAQMAAKYEYDRTGVYDDLQPQFIYQMVFVFDVPPQYKYTLWYRPWGSTGVTFNNNRRLTW